MSTEEEKKLCSHPPNSPIRPNQRNQTSSVTNRKLEPSHRIQLFNLNNNNWITVTITLSKFIFLCEVTKHRTINWFKFHTAFSGKPNTQQISIYTNNCYENWELWKLKLQINDALWWRKDTYGYSWKVAKIETLVKKSRK